MRTKARDNEIIIRRTPAERNPIYPCPYGPPQANPANAASQ